MIKENDLLTRNVCKLKGNKSKVIEDYEIKQMMVQSLTIYLEILEEDHANVMHEGGVIAQDLEKEIYNLHLKSQKLIKLR